MAPTIMSSRQTKYKQGGRNEASAINRSTFPGSDLTRHRSTAPADPQARFERYLTLARTAAASGDTIETEWNFQHAEHYFRLMTNSTP